DLKRRKRAEGAGWTTYLWDREQVLMELNKTGTTTVRYTQAPRGYGDVISQRRSSASTYWHFDAIGSMRFLTAADQSKAINYVYDAFGITRSVSGTTTNRFRYIGRLGYYLEPALGCYYLRRRYYVHWLGRFLSKDPLRQGGENAYGYVNNAPTTATDASGLWSVQDWYEEWIAKMALKKCQAAAAKRKRDQIRKCEPAWGLARPPEQDEEACEDKCWELFGGKAGQTLAICLAGCRAGGRWPADLKVTRNGVGDSTSLAALLQLLASCGDGPFA
ncbi:MAG: RHS repeat-associated core domain-containing protein, partial [Armatimonadetes bacterium]|nr:RHS repeat-associated core domain-containing protein [Armatimonadota bacterium]